MLAMIAKVVVLEGNRTEALEQHAPPNTETAVAGAWPGLRVRGAHASQGRAEGVQGEQYASPAPSPLSAAPPQMLKRFHGSDGLILTSVGPYSEGRCASRPTTLACLLRFTVHPLQPRAVLQVEVPRTHVRGLCGAARPPTRPGNECSGSVWLC